MKYQDFSHTQIVTYGINLFLIMSTDYFFYMSNEIEMLRNIPETDDILRIARQFCENALPAIGVSIPDQKVDENYYNQEKLLDKWNDLFSNLAAMGYAEPIERWLDHLMLIKNHFIPIWGVSEIPYLLSDWDTNSSIPNLETVPELTGLRIKIAALNYFRKYSQLCCKLSVLIDHDKEPWSRYVMKSLSTTSWMQNTMNNHYNLAMWVEIFNLVDDTRLSELDKWLEMVCETLAIKQDFHLWELRRDLKIHGLI
jgi:hypothetical protein